VGIHLYAFLFDLNTAAGRKGSGMEKASHHGGYRLYWITWIVLLAITLGMLVADSAPVPRWILLSVLLAAMAVKAGYIAFNFMHLRFEQPVLVIIVAAGLLLTGLVLFLFLAADSLHILRLSSG
jgi:cytochrome c oxidase subunit IV